MRIRDNLRTPEDLERMIYREYFGYFAPLFFFSILGFLSAIVFLSNRMFKLSLLVASITFVIHLLFDIFWMIFERKMIEKFTRNDLVNIGKSYIKEHENDLS